MAGMGPAPKHPSQRRRTNKTVNLTRLPLDGRRGLAPDWPLDDAPTTDQRRLWAQLWCTPQAAAWEKLGWTRVVCRYVKALLIAESTFGGPILAECRQLEDRLGLSPMAMRRLGWEIEESEPAPRSRPGEVTQIADYRSMFED